jgi:hypothetical protein
MTTSAEAYSFLKSVDKLKDGGSNWPSFRVAMEEALNLGEVLEWIELPTSLTAPTAPAADQAAIAAYATNDRRARGLIISKLEAGEAMQARGRTAPALWSFLKLKYEPTKRNQFRAL